MRAFAAHWGDDALAAERRLVVIETAVSVLGELFLVVGHDEHVSWQSGYPRFVAFCDTSASVRDWLRHGRTVDSVESGPMTLSDADRAAIEARHYPEMSEYMSAGHPRPLCHWCRLPWGEDGCDAHRLRAALSDAEADAEQHRLDAASWRVEAERAADKYHEARADAERLAEALEYEASLHPYPGDVPDIVNRALALHRERRPVTGGPT